MGKRGRRRECRALGAGARGWHADERAGRAGAGRGCRRARGRRQRRAGAGAAGAGARRASGRAWARRRALQAVGRAGAGARGRGARERAGAGSRSARARGSKRDERMHGRAGARWLRYDTAALRCDTAGGLGHDTTRPPTTRPRARGLCAQAGPVGPVWGFVHSDSVFGPGSTRYFS